MTQGAQLGLSRRSHDGKFSYVTPSVTERKYCVGKLDVGVHQASCEILRLRGRVSKNAFVFGKRAAQNHNLGHSRIMVVPITPKPQGGCKPPPEARPPAAPVGRRCGVRSNIPGI